MEFNSKHQALLDVKVALDITPLNPEVPGEVSVTPADLMVLWFLFADHTRKGGQDE